MANQPRLAPLAPPNLTPEQQTLYDTISGGRRTEGRPAGGGLAYPDGSLAGPFNAYLYTPAIGHKLEQVGASLRFDTEVARNLVELAIIVVGRHWTAQFEWYAHARMARQAGVADAIVDAIAARQEPAFVDANEAAVYRFTKELCENHGVSDPTYAALRDKIGDRQVVELTMVIGYYNYVSAMLNTFDVRLPDGVAPLAD